MSLIHRHGRCIGLTVFRWGKRQVEVWYVPKNEEIFAHYHTHCDSTIVPLLGSMSGAIHTRCGKTGWWDFGRRFRVPANTVHYAFTGDSFCLFANYEKWDCEPTSAAIDFVY